MSRCVVPSRCSSRKLNSLSTKLDDTKRQQRKLVSYNQGLGAISTRYRHILLLLLSIHCIDLIQCGQVSPPNVTGLGKSISSSTSSTGKDSSSRGSGSVSPSDDGESSSHPHLYHHHHNYRHHHHRHGTSGKNLPHGSPAPSSSIYPSTSALGYQEYSPLNYYNSDPYYEPRYYERPSREFSARSTSYPAMVAAASSSQVGFSDTEYGGLALATGHGGGHGGHGHGHDSGYGHGHHTTYHKTVHKLDQSSLGLLGLLGLLSLLSNVLLLLTTTTTTTTPAPVGGGRTMRVFPNKPAKEGHRDSPRLKRDTMMVFNLNDEPHARRSVIEKFSQLIFPSLNIVGHAKDGRIPLNCTYQEVCKSNKVIVQVFGSARGRPVATVLSSAITKLLANDNGNNTKKDNQVSHSNIKEGHLGTTMTPLLLKNLLTEAGLAGRNGENCEIAYPTCKALSKVEDEDYSINGISQQPGSSRLPFLVSPDHAVAIIMGQSYT